MIILLSVEDTIMSLTYVGNIIVSSCGILSSLCICSLSQSAFCIICEYLLLNFFNFFSYFFLAHLAFRPSELLSSLFIRRPSVNISHFNLLLRNHWANCIQTLVEWPPSKIVSGDPDFQPRWPPR
jgi:hypothetical protein